MILIECNNDEELVKQLGFKNKQCKHELNKGEVVKRLKRESNISIGIVDEDKEADQPSDMKFYHTIDTVGSIKLKRKDSIRFLIVISPRLEEWIYGVARRNKIIPEDYGLPKVAHRLPKKPDHKFKEFLKVLIENNDLEIETMRQWIMETIQQ
jgi:exoribonuclease R